MARPVRVMGEPAWAMETRFATIQGRWQHRHDLDAHLGQWTATHDAQALMHLLQAHGVPAGTVHTARDLADPHLRERAYLEVFTNANAPSVGPRVYAGRPFARCPMRRSPCTWCRRWGSTTCRSCVTWRRCPRPRSRA